jgi:flagellar hook-associated protein 3 FlgL
MSINGIGSPSSPLGQAIRSLNNQLANLTTQLASGEKSTTYAGMGPNEGFAIAARAQLASISAFSDTITNVNTIINATNNALQSLSDIGDQVQSAAAGTPQTLDSTGQTIAQQNAAAEFDSMIGILNSPTGTRYLFSGNAINTPSTAPADQIMNGTSTQAGLKQVISERAQADGTTGTGRLVISNPTTTPTTVSVAEDAAGSPFGLKLNDVSSSLTGATVTGPGGSPAGISIDLGTTNPNPGDQVTFTFNLPDGTTSTVQLTASSATPPPAGSFSIGATPADTAANLNTALNTSIGTLAGTTLTAASAVAAGNDFFGSPPQRVSVTPPATLSSATSLTDGSPNTVSWYTGNSGPGPAIASATSRVDQSITVQYGAQANEDAIRSQLQSIAVYAAFTTSPTGTNSTAAVSALSQRTATNLTAQPGQQTIEDIQSQFAAAQTIVKDTSARQTQTQNMLQNMVDSTETVSTDQVATEILALQNVLQASYQTTSMLSKLSLTNFLPLG